MTFFCLVVQPNLTVAMDKANGDSLSPHENTTNTMPDNDSEEEEEEEELLGAVGGAPVDAPVSQSEAYFLWLRSLEEEEEKEKEERRRRLLREELELERQEYNREEERRRQALENRITSISFSDTYLRENWIRTQVNTKLFEKAMLQQEYTQKKKQFKEAVKDFFKKKAEVQSIVTCFGNYDNKDYQLDENFLKCSEKLDAKSKEFSEAVSKKEELFDECVKILDQNNECSRQLRALRVPARQAKVLRSSLRNWNRYWIKVRKHLQEIECFQEQRAVRKIEKSFQKILKKNSKGQLELGPGVFYDLSWFSSHGVISDATSESSSDSLSREGSSDEFSDQEEHGDIEYDVTMFFNRTGASASADSPQNDTRSGDYYSDVEGYDGDVEGNNDEDSSDSDWEEESSSSSEEELIPEVRWNVPRWHQHGNIVHRDTCFSDAEEPVETVQQSSSRQDELDPSDTNQQGGGGEDTSQQHMHERMFASDTEHEHHEHTTDTNAGQSSGNTEQGENVEQSSTEHRSEQVAEEGKPSRPIVRTSSEQRTTLLQSSDTSVSEHFSISQHTDVAYGYGFDREGDSTYLYGLQTAIFRDSEYVVTTLRTVALHSYNMNRCLSNRKSHRNRRVRSLQRKQDSASVLSIPSVQEMYRDFYEFMAVADTSTSNLEQKIRSSRACITTVPIQGWSLGFAYNYSKEPSKEYARILHTHRGSVTSTAETDTLVTTIAWNTDKQGFSGHLAGCYGWGKVKNSRCVRHGDTIAVAKGTPNSTLCGGLVQLGYRFSLSNTLHIMPYVECLVSTVRWQSYNEGFTPLPCSITRNKEKVIEKSIGMYNRWQHSDRSQLQVWVAGISGYCQTDSLSLRAMIRQHPLYEVRIPSKKKQYSKGEVGVSYQVTMKDAVYIGLRGKIQYMNSHKDRIEQHISMNVQYVY